MSKEILKLTGAITHIGELQKGKYKKGKREGEEWTAQEIVIKPEGKWAKPAAFREFNPAKDLNEVYNVGDFIEVNFNIASREYKERWYTNLDCWEIRKLTDSKDEIKFDGDKPTDPPPTASEEDQDLPF